VPIYKRIKIHQIVTNSTSKSSIEDLRHYAQSTNESHVSGYILIYLIFNNLSF
jgi:hypothetical protein